MKSSLTRRRTTQRQRAVPRFSAEFVDAANTVVTRCRVNGLTLGCLVIGTGPSPRTLPSRVADTLADLVEDLYGEATYVRPSMVVAQAIVLVAGSDAELEALRDAAPERLVVPTDVPPGARLLAGRSPRGSSLALATELTTDSMGVLSWEALIARATRNSDRHMFSVDLRADS